MIPLLKNCLIRTLFILRQPITLKKIPYSILKPVFVPTLLTLVLDAFADSDNARLNVHASEEGVRVSFHTNVDQEYWVSLRVGQRPKAIYHRKLIPSARGTFQVLLPSGYFLRHEYLIGRKLGINIHSGESLNPIASALFRTPFGVMSSVCLVNALNFDAFVTHGQSKASIEQYLNTLILAETHEHQRHKSALISALLELNSIQFISDVMQQLKLDSVRFSETSVSHYQFPSDKIILSAKQDVSLVTFLHEIAHFIDYRFNINQSSNLSIGKISELVEYQEAAMADGLSSYLGPMDARCASACQKEVFADNLGELLLSADANSVDACSTTKFFNKVFSKRQLFFVKASERPNWSATWEAYNGFAAADLNKLIGSVEAVLNVRSLGLKSILESPRLRGVHLALAQDGVMISDGWMRSSAVIKTSPNLYDFFHEVGHFLNGVLVRDLPSYLDSDGYSLEYLHEWPPFRKSLKESYSSADVWGEKRNDEMFANIFASFVLMSVSGWESSLVVHPSLELQQWMEAFVDQYAKSFNSR